MKISTVYINDRTLTEFSMQEERFSLLLQTGFRSFPSPHTFSQESWTGSWRLRHGTRLEGDRSVLVWRWTFSKRFLSFPFSFSFWNVHFFYLFFLALWKPCSSMRVFTDRLVTELRQQLGAPCALRRRALVTLALLQPQQGPHGALFSLPFLLSFAFLWSQPRFFFSGWGSEISVISRNSRLESFSKFQIWHEERRF